MTKMQEKCHFMSKIQMLTRAGKYAMLYAVNCCVQVRRGADLYEKFRGRSGGAVGYFFGVADRHDCRVCVHI